jgi:hypothetical protein
MEVRLTVVCQQIGSDEPCSLLQSIEAAGNLDKGSSDDCSI